MALVPLLLRARLAPVDGTGKLVKRMRSIMEHATEAMPTIEHATQAMPTLENVRVAVVGVGYVGLPVAAHLGRHFPVVGFDVNEQRIAELDRGFDRTYEVSKEELALAKNIALHPISAGSRAPTSLL